MALPIQVNPKDPCIDIHTGRGQGSCTFANGFNCVCSCAGIAHAQLLRMVLTPENSKELPDKYKQALANKVQTVQARIADIPHDKVTTIIHAQKQPKRVFFLCEDVSHPIIDYCRVIDILRWARENPLASQQVSKLCTCVQNHGINSFTYKIGISVEDMDLLIEKIHDYTINLANNNQIALTEQECRRTNDFITNLQNYSKIQKRIFEKVA